MKMKKVLAVALSLASIAAFSATAFATDATYDEASATASLVLKDGDITGAGGQMTVAVVPKDFQGDAADIYYINQGDFATEFAGIIANMGLKADIDANNFEVRICGESMSTYATFNFATVVDILWGDADNNGDLTVNDATRILQKLGGQDVEVKDPEYDADGNYDMTVNDATRILQKLGGQDVPMGRN